MPVPKRQSLVQKKHEGFSSWRNRIVGEEDVPPDQLLANPHNFKIHGTFQKQALMGILDEVGWVQRIIVNRTTNCVLDGHARIQVALQRNEPLVPVLYVEVSEAEEKLLLASLDTLTGLASVDSELLAQLLHDVSTGDSALQQMLSELAAREGVLEKLQGQQNAAEGLPRSVPVGSLADRFLVPPFSVFDARQGYWQARKRAWLALGIQSELGRGETSEPDGLLGFSEQARSHYNSTLGAIPNNQAALPQRRFGAAPGGSLRDATTLGKDGHTKRGDGHGRRLQVSDTSAYKAQGRLTALQRTGSSRIAPGGSLETATHYKADGTLERADLHMRSAVYGTAGNIAGEQTGTSVFDPVLCEIAYRWFCPPGGHVLDPFAGGSVRGIVAAALGRRYAGIDLRPEQVTANKAQWAQIGPSLPRATPTLSTLEPPQVETIEGFRIVRDDRILGGTKTRALLQFLPTIPSEEVVYASPAYGFAQIALALAAAQCGKRASIFTAARRVPHARTQRAAQHGATIHYVPAGYLSNVQAKARQYAEKHAALLLPFGLDAPWAEDAIATVARATGEEPTEVWCVAGSGTLARGLHQAWPQAKLCCVVIGKQPRLPEGNVMVYTAPEAFEHEAQDPPPFPSCSNYDAKAWRFLRAHGAPGALFWNVGADDAQAVRRSDSPSRPQWVVGDAQNVTALCGGEAAYDFLFTCPPYASLEQYSDDPRDLSTMPYERFLCAYRTIIAESVQLLAEDRFACIVVGDIRDAKGYYQNFVSDTIAAFHEAGARLYNEAILITAFGSLPLRAGIPFQATRKLGKTHQNVLVFCKGDSRRATEACGPAEVGDDDLFMQEADGGHGTPDNIL